MRHNILVPRGNECSILDFTNQGIEKIEIIPNADPIIVILDRNAISKIENLEYYKHLEQLSIGENQLMSMVGVSTLYGLTVLNLPSNKIHCIEGVHSLHKLQWLNVSKNNINNLNDLQGLTSLQHLDLSDNLITHLGDLSHLTQLKALLLHGNELTTIKTAPSHLPTSLNILSLAENNISDLNELSYLVNLVNLEQLSLMNNPCVLVTSLSLVYDYRPFVINWCMNLRVLDGFLVTEKEGLKAEWLFSQGRGRHFAVGQHQQLVHYLASVYQLSGSAQPEDVKLARVLQQQKVHQQQLHQDTCPPQSRVGAGQPSPKRSHSPSSESHNMGLRRNSRESAGADMVSQSHDVGPASVYGGQYRGSPYKPWPGRSSVDDAGSRPHTAPPASVDHGTHMTHQSLPQYQYPHLDRYDMASGDETSSVLDAETRFLPLHSELSASPHKPFNLEYLLSQRPKSFTNGDKPYTDPIVQRGEPRTALCADPVRDLSPAGDHRHEQDGNRPVVHRRLAANFSQVNPNGRVNYDSNPPQKVVSSPSVNPVLSNYSHLDRLSQSPGSHGNLETGDDVTDFDGFSTDSSQASLELKLLKALLDKRNSEKKQKKSSNRRSRDHGLHGDHGVQRPNQVANSRSSLSELPSRQYTPEKYRSPGRRSRQSPQSDASHQETDDMRYRNNSGHTPMSETQLLEEIGKLRLEDDSNGEDRDRMLAATKLQAFWRGFLVRNKDPYGQHVRKELRSRRSEEHIRSLKAQVERHKKLYKTERHLRSMQVEAMKFLWKEVQELQQWKSNVLISQERIQHPHIGGSAISDSQITLENIPLVLESLQISKDGSESGRSAQSINNPVPSFLSPNPTIVLPPGVQLHTSSSQVRASQKEAELEMACKSLQKQVSHLQQMLTSMSHVVFPAQSVQIDSQISDTRTEKVTSDAQTDLTGLETIRLSMDAELPIDPSVTSHRQSISLSTPAPNPDTPQPGYPTVPRDLTLVSNTATAVQLSWKPATIVPGHQTSDDPKSLLGYRIFLNGSCTGMIPAGETTVVLNGLSATTVYRITVRSVSVVGESSDSNIVLIGPESESMDSRTGDGPSPRTGDRKASPHRLHKRGSSNDGRSELSNDNKQEAGAEQNQALDSVQQSKHRLSTLDSVQQSKHRQSSPNSKQRNSSPDKRQQGNSPDNRRGNSPDSRHGNSPGRSPAYDSSTPKSGKQSEMFTYDDSGYLTSPGVVSANKDKITKVGTTERMTDVSVENDRKSTVRKMIFDSSSKDSSDRIAVVVPILDSAEEKGIIGNSPRISEGLTRKLEGSKEIKQAVKSQKRKPSPDHITPLRAIPSDPDIRDKSVPLKAFPSDPEISDKYNSADILDDPDHKQKSSKIPILSRKTSTSSSDGSKSRRSSLGDPRDSRSRQNSGNNDDNKSRKSSMSDVDCDLSSSSKVKKNQETLNKVLNDASAQAKATLERYQLATTKVKSNTFGAESPSNPLTSASDQKPQCKTWPSEKPKDPVSLDDVKILTDDDVVSRSEADGQSPRPNRRHSQRFRYRSGSDSSHDDTALGNLDDTAMGNLEQRRSERKWKRRSSGHSSSSRKSSASDSDNVNVDLSSSPEQTAKQAFIRQSRGRASVREPKKPREVMTEKRASSVGPPIQVPSGGDIVTDKPPLARPPHSRIPDAPPTPTSSRRRTKSEQGTSSSDEHNLGLVQSVAPENVIASPRESRKSLLKISHRRSASDAAVVPSLEISDRRPSTPSAPMQCPSSPRVRRSSSFSKALTPDKSGEALLRQCISLETLKAAKSPDAGEKLAAHYKQKLESAEVAGRKYDTDYLSTETNYFRRSHSLRETKSKSQHYQSDSNGKFNLEVADDMAASKPETYSPRLNAGKKDLDSKHRKIKLGHKAADLFAKLQLKLSNHKN